ncbi:MAG TPA: CRISPR-associated endonuclease Cas3'' [Gammaproteobacteria bacterium]|nr:CRISPR-associated endonuclease Cas3'' [Gammaproteobacteria bacterium]
MQPAAHTRRVGDQIEIHSLEEHLREVARMARAFAEPFGGGPWAELAGLWHDLGKYRAGFQDYIRRIEDPHAHIEGRAVVGRDKTERFARAARALRCARGLKPDSAAF